MSLAAQARARPGVLAPAALDVGCLTAALVPLLVLILAFACVLVAIGWIGQETAGLGGWIEGLFGGGAHPAVASTESRPTEWLGALGSYTGSPAPSSLMLAIMQQKRGARRSSSVTRAGTAPSPTAAARRPRDGPWPAATASTA